MMALDYLFCTSTRPSLSSFTSLQFPQAKANTNINAFTLKGQSVVGCIKGHKIRCTLIKGKDLSSSVPHNLEREPHKYFDHVVITVRSGDGGHGAVLSMPKPAMQQKNQGKKTKEKVKRKGSYKRDPDGNLILPMGGHGGDVVLYADESKDSLLELHQINRYNAKRGGNVDAMGALTPMLHDGFAAPTLRIPVPVGTVVKRKRGGKLFADLTHPGDEILVARGGRGGISLVEMHHKNRRRLESVHANVIRDENDKTRGIFVKHSAYVLNNQDYTLILLKHFIKHLEYYDDLKSLPLGPASVAVMTLGIFVDQDMAFGQPGEEVRLELILRIVADVGIVGLPNAGKSSLLAAVTRARPDIADYPFTTLMPNLGQLAGDPDLGNWGSATLADMPGLIRGAHLGKGLGRTFLRHLRRTHLLVHVVDASVADPVQDYRTVREELLMYNPAYLERPHMVVLNKLDLPQAREKFDSISEHVAKIGCPEAVTSGKYMLVEENKSREGETYRLPYGETADNLIKQEKEIEDYSRPLAIIGISALKGIGIVEMLREIQLALKSFEVGEREEIQNKSTLQTVIQKFC